MRFNNTFLIIFFYFISTSLSAFAAQKLRVGVMVGAPATVMKTAQKIAQKKYDIDLKVIPFANYQIPNEILNNGDIDANIFQTRSFLEFSIKNGGYENLVSAGETFIYPMGIYSQKFKSISDLPPDAHIAIPNDPSNRARALHLLQNAGIITLKKSQDHTLPSLSDVISLARKLKIDTMDAARIARVLKDYDAVALNNDFLTGAGLKLENAIFYEKKEDSSIYANVIVVKKDNLKNPNIMKLVEIMHSEEVTQETQRLFPGAIPAWK